MDINTITAVADALEISQRAALLAQSLYTAAGMPADRLNEVVKTLDRLTRDAEAVRGDMQRREKMHGLTDDQKRVMQRMHPTLAWIYGQVMTNGEYSVPRALNSKNEDMVRSFCADLIERGVATWQDESGRVLVKVEQITPSQRSIIGEMNFAGNEYIEPRNDAENTDCLALVALDLLRKRPNMPGVFTITDKGRAFK